DAGRARAFGTPADGAEVPRIRDLVEAGEQRPLRGGELPRVRVLVRLAPGDDTLVVARRRSVGQLTLGLDLQARPFDLAQPRLGLDRPVRRPALEHLAPPVQRLPHRAATEHLAA